MIEDSFFKEEEQNQGLLIKNIIFKYLRYWYWFLGGLVLAFIIAVLYMRYSPKIYASQAKIKILEESEGIDLSNAMNLWSKNSIKLDSEIEILKSYPLIEKVVTNQDLVLKYYEVGNVQTSEISDLPFEFTRSIKQDSIINTFGFEISVNEDNFTVEELETDRGFQFLKPDETQIFSKHTSSGIDHILPFELNPLAKKIPRDAIGMTFKVYFIPAEDVIYELKEAIQIEPIGEDTELLKLSLKSESDEKNERILNELIKVFNQDGIDDRRAVSLRTYEFIDQRFITLVDELDSLETDIQDFKQRNEIITLESKADVGINELNEIGNRQFELENQLLLIEILENSLRDADDKIDLLAANMGIDNDILNTLVDNYNEMALEFLTLSRTLTDKNPELQSLKSNLENIKRNIFISIQTSRNQLQAALEKANKKNEDLIDEIYKIPAKEKIFLDIKRQQEIKQELYLYLLQKREEAVISFAITEPTLKVVEPALSSKKPVSPKTTIVFATAFMLGLGLPFAVLYVSFLLDTKIHNRESIEKETKNIPVIAELPKNKKDNMLSFIKENDSSVQAEAFRVLSYNIKYMLTSNEEDKGKIIFSTSTIKGEGKTHISMNLALALSSLNHKVLLIGADIRNPQLHNYINVNKNVDGLTKYLHEHSYDWHEGLYNKFDEHQNLSIFLGGSIPPNPSKLLTSPRFKKLLEEAKEEYEYIIVDTAPTLLVSDTLLISSHADATVYVTRANFTEMKLLDFSKNLAETGKLKNMAYVINALDLKKSSGYGYGYNYGYNYGYKTEKQS
jgi:capsular exopolysaccharide synthesis family protein